MSVATNAIRGQHHGRTETRPADIARRGPVKKARDPVPPWPPLGANPLSCVCISFPFPSKPFPTACRTKPRRNRVASPGLKVVPFVNQTFPPLARGWRNLHTWSSAGFPLPTDALLTLSPRSFPSASLISRQAGMPQSARRWGATSASSAWLPTSWHRLRVKRRARSDSVRTS